MSSSLTTITGIINIMIGSPMLTFPILFRQGGLGFGLIILFCSALISYKTCQLYVIHISPKQKTIQETVRRILGQKWQLWFKKSTGLAIMLTIALYVVLIVDQSYNILYFSLRQSGHAEWIADKDVDHLVFDKFSIQYLSLILFLPILRMAFITNFSILLRLTSLGFLSVVIYIIFVFYQFSSVVGEISYEQIPFFRKQFSNLLGTSAIAFIIHPATPDLMKANVNQKNNVRDLRISFLCGFLIYAVIGTLGSLSILNKKCKITIVNCYLDEWQALSIQIVYFLMLLTIFPYLLDVGRTRLLHSYFNPVTKSHITKFNLFFVSFFISLAFFGPYVPLDLTMNLFGSIISFFIIYMFPIKFHWKCLYRRKTQSLLESSLSQTSQIGTIVCNHIEDRVDSSPKWSRLLLYGTIFCVGTASSLFGIIGFFQQVFFN